MPRIVVFCDGNNLSVDWLLRSLASAVRRNPACTLVGIVAAQEDTRPGSRQIAAIADSAGIPVINYKKGMLKDPRVVEQLFNELKPDTLFNLFGLEIFSAQFLDRFEYTVNFHNGLLPQYRGLNASAWALVLGESRCGYTFHRITPELDAGNILIQGEIKIKPGDRMHDLERKMARHARKRMRALLSMITEQHPGSAQVGKHTYFSNADRRRITNLASPGSLPTGQLVNLCRAFGAIDMKLGGRWFRIRQIRRAHPTRRHSDCLYFNAADGDLVEACERTGVERVRFRLKRVLSRLANWP